MDWSQFERNSRRYSPSKFYIDPLTDPKDSEKIQKNNSEYLIKIWHVAYPRNIVFKLQVDGIKLKEK